MKNFYTLFLCTIMLPYSVFAASNEAPVEEVATAAAVESTSEVIVETKKADNPLTDEQVKLLSKAYGHMIGDNLADIGLALDNNAILQGIQGAFNGEESPLDDTRTIEMITKMQEDKFRLESQNNLKEAEAFLAANAKEDGTVVLETDKLQFTRLADGSGKACREEDTPIITYKGSYLNGETFGQSDSEKGEPICLQDTIAGFRKAIVGMKVGEKRKVYIHPDLGYGAGSRFSPNALLTFEIALEGIEKAAKEAEKDPSIGGMGALPDENAFADTLGPDSDHENLK
ncbi:FKBP-type peptidyl-prolyl cis-trans isomerase [bacterium]|nr:FKBP-type peptidyl-prolyl cis-trans isomerase [bacterium]